jgi:2-polyprenyl-3-methyl-5-hydroxy-6-metoxy-1,4-benzoquinol methylase
MNILSQNSIKKVKAFWNANPLWTGESKYEPGSKEFFEEYKKIVLEDCYAGEMDDRVFPKVLGKELVLDLGCGPGFGTVEITCKGNKNIVAADLIENSISLASKRCTTY